MRAIATLSELDRPGWLKVRQQGIGGSDVGAILGLSKFRSALDVYLDKTTEVEESEETAAQHWGNRLEGVVADEFAERTGLGVQVCESMYAHDDYPFVIGNPDRWIMDAFDPGAVEGILEIKTSRMDQWWADGIPDEYACQVQHYLAVTGMDYAYLAVLLHGREYQHYRIARDDAMITNLLLVEEAFWERVVSRTPPDPDDSLAAAEALKRLYPEGAGVVELGADTENLLHDLKDAKAEEKAAVERVRALESTIKARIGEADTVLVHDRVVATWKNVTTKRLNAKRLEAEQPAIAADYTEASTHRRFVNKV